MTAGYQFLVYWQSLLVDLFERIITSKSSVETQPLEKTIPVILTTKPQILCPQTAVLSETMLPMTLH